MVPERMEASNTHSEADARVQIQDIIEEMKDNLNLAEPGSDSLDQLIDRVDKIFNDVVDDGEEGGTSIDVSVARLDIHAFSQLARQCHLRVRRVAASSWVFRASDFANRIVRLLNVDEGSQSESLTDTTKAKLDAKVSPHFNRCPPLRPLLGAIQLTKVEAVPKERKQRQPREKQQAVVAQKPKRLTDITEEDQNTKVTRRVEFIHKELKKLVRKNETNRHSFYHFIVNPTSFSDTVENLFYVSFLLRDGFVALDEETESGLPDLVVTNKKSSSDSQAQTGVTKKQLILALDHGMWQELVQGLNLDKPAIPTAEEQAAREAKEAAERAAAAADAGPSQNQAKKKSRRE